MSEGHESSTAPGDNLTAGPAARVRIYIRVSDQGQHGPLFLQVLRFLKDTGAAGATVIRAIAGFGTHGPIQTMNVLDVSEDLPLIIEFVDSEEYVARVLPQLKMLIPAGLITMETVQVIKYARQGQAQAARSLLVRVRDVMSTQVTTLAPSATVAEVMQALLSSTYFKTIPIIDEKRQVLGVVTDGDLLRRSDVPLHLQASISMSAAELQQLLDQVRHSQRTAADLMTHPVITFPADLPVGEATAQMAAHRLKRVPIIDQQQRLVGILGRVDILRLAVGEGRPGPASSLPAQPGPAPHPAEIGLPAVDRQRLVREVMVSGVVTVRPETGLVHVIEQLIHSTLRRLVVVDAQGRICGVISEMDLVTRLGRQDQPAVLRALATRLPFLKQPADIQAQARRLEGLAAADIMTRQVITIAPDQSLVRAIQLMLAHHVRFLPVVEGDGRLVGIVRRSDLLRAVAEPVERSGE